MCSPSCTTLESLIIVIIDCVLCELQLGKFLMEIYFNAYNIKQCVSYTKDRFASVYLVLDSNHDPLIRFIDCSCSCLVASIVRLSLWVSR